MEYIKDQNKGKKKKPAVPVFGRHAWIAKQDLKSCRTCKKKASLERSWLLFKEEIIIKRNMYKEFKTIGAGHSIAKVETPIGSIRGL